MVTPVLKRRRRERTRALKKSVLFADVYTEWYYYFQELIDRSLLLYGEFIAVRTGAEIEFIEPTDDRYLCYLCKLKVLGYFDKSMSFTGSFPVSGG